MVDFELNNSHTVFVARSHCAICATYIRTVFYNTHVLYVSEEIPSSSGYKERGKSPESSRTRESAAAACTGESGSSIFSIATYVPVMLYLFS